MPAQPGICIISPRGKMPYPAMLNAITTAGLKAVKFHIGQAFSTDPSDIQTAIALGVETIILRTDDGLPGYQYEVIRDLIEQPGGIAHYSYASLMLRYPKLNWWIEVGNEPNMAGMDGWHARWWALAAYKELALNYLGHIDRPWRDKYPMLKWSCCLPTKLGDAEDMLTWFDNHGSDDVGDGSIIDYYDALNCHLYGDYNLGDGGYDWARILHLVCDNPYTKQVMITELGINDPHTPMRTKASRYHAWLQQAHPKVTHGFVWVLGQQTGFPTYEMSDPSVVKTIVRG